MWKDIYEKTYKTNTATCISSKLYTTLSYRGTQLDIFNNTEYIVLYDVFFKPTFNIFIISISTKLK